MMHPNNIFPDEIWISIISYCDLRTIINIVRICSFFRGIATSNLITLIIEKDIWNSRVLLSITLVSKYWSNLVQPYLDQNELIIIDDVPCILPLRDYKIYNTTLHDAKMGYPLQTLIIRTRKVCLAVKYNGLALQYVDEQDDEICTVAVGKNIYALEYVKNQDHDMCMNAVKKNSSIVEYVKIQSLDICLEAVRNNGLTLQYIKEETPSICLEAVKQYGMA